MSPVLVLQYPLHALPVDLPDACAFLTTLARGHQVSA